MTKINLIQKGENYEIEMVSLKKITSIIYKTNGKQFNQSSKRWTIPKESKEKFLNDLKEIATVEVKDGNEERKFNLSIERDQTRIYVSVVNFPKIRKGLDPLFSFFKTIPGRMYDAANKKWSFSIADDNILMDGIKKVTIENGLLHEF
jgi:hypothetical protein